MPHVIFTAVVPLQHAEQPLGSHRGLAGAGEEPAVRAGPATLLVSAMRQVVARAERIRPPGLVDAVAGDQDLAWFISMSARAFLANVDTRSASR